MDSFVNTVSWLKNTIETVKHRIEITLSSSNINELSNVRPIRADWVVLPRSDDEDIRIRTYINPEGKIFIIIVDESNLDDYFDLIKSSVFPSDELTAELEEAINNADTPTL
jgi:hypothetical protein